MLKTAHKLKWLHAVFTNCKFPQGITYKHVIVFKELMLLSTFPNGNVSVASHNTLARRTCMSVSSIKRLLDVLMALKVVEHTRRFSKSNEYVAHWESLEGASAVNAIMESCSDSSPDEPSCDSSRPEPSPKVMAHNEASDSSKSCSDSSKVASDSSRHEPLRGLGLIGITTTGVEEGMSNHTKVLKIWTSWNDAMTSIGLKGTTVPAAYQSGVVPNNPTKLYQYIDKWITVNPDWESRWQQVIDEIPVNKWFKGFVNAKGEFKRPTLQTMFVPKDGFYQRGTGKFIPPKQSEIGVERVLANEFEGFRAHEHVNTTSVEEMAKKPTQIDGFDCF